MMSFGRFEQVSTSRRLWVMVTHLDHIGVEARKQQALKIREWMATQSGPYILTGDFNDAPGSEVHRLLTAADPVSVYCHEWNPAGSWYDHDASAVAFFEMSDGLVYTYRGSWCAEGLVRTGIGRPLYSALRGTLQAYAHGSH